MGHADPSSQQIEFARLALTYTVMSKRFLLKLVTENRVSGWDDPRMPTLCGIRRRGYTAESLRAFCEDIGVTRANSLIDVGRLENACRDHLNKVAPRRMAVLNPLKVVIENYPEGPGEEFEAMNNPENPAAGGRMVKFTREIYIDRDDFMEVPPKKFFRLAPGAEVRLRAAYWVKCTNIIKDTSGNITELRCTYDPQTRGGSNPPDGRKVKGTIHWVSATHGVRAEIRSFDRLFHVEQPGEKTGDYLDDVNPNSLAIIKNAIVEPSLASRGTDEPDFGDGLRRFQFERIGYFCLDRDSTKDHLVFNRIVTLKDTWTKIADRA